MKDEEQEMDKVLPEFPKLHSYGNKHLRVLMRRAAHLAARIEACPVPSALAYDEAELKALTWVFKNFQSRIDHFKLTARR